MSLGKLASVGRRAPGGRERRRLERLSQMREDLPDRPWFSGRKSAATGGLPHIYNHGVDERDVEFVVRQAREARPGRDGSRIAVGQAYGGRYRRGVYVR